MYKTLLNNLQVNKDGWVFIPYDILEDYIDPTLTKIPFDFNDAENQINIDLGVNQDYIDDYEKRILKQNRKFVHFEVIKKKIKKTKKIEDLIDSLSRKLASLENLSELTETLHDIDDIYDLERNFCFSFNKSNYLHKFYNQNFELLISEDKKKFKQIIFNFKSINEITPRTLNTKIHQGTLLIHKDGPPKVVKHFMNKNYVIIKLYSLLENHSDYLKDVYDILITCNEEIVKPISQSKHYKNPNIFFGVYSNKSQNFYISKLTFKKFVKASGQKFLYINNVLTNKIVELPFMEEMYDQFLIKHNHYDEKSLQIIKNKANRGISEYYSYYKNFLDRIRNKRIFLINNRLEKLNENLENLDFLKISKREIFDVDVKIHFMDNLDIIITREPNLKIDYSSNTLLDGLKNNIEKAKNLFLEEYDTLLKNGELYEINEKFYKNVFDILKNLKYSSALNLHPEFIKDCFYYSAILKNNVDLIRSYFMIKDSIILDTIAIVLGIQNSFRNHFPKENATAYFNLFFTSKFANFPEIKSSMFNIKKYCQDMIFIFEATQDLKLLQRELKNKFQSNVKLKSVVKNIEKSIDKKIKMQEDFGQILEVIKKEVRVKKSSPKNVNEIKKILEQELRGEFSEEQYIESVKSIEALLKSNMKPIIGYDVILKHLDSCFKKKLTSNKQVDEIIEYINSNLKAEFEDKEKFNSIVKGIRKTYDSKFEDRKKYYNILNQLEKRFESLNAEEDIQKIQLYIKKNLENVFESSQERQSIFRQIDREFLNKTENPKELEDIIKLSAELVKIFINDTGWHSIIVASIFTGFILALNLDKEITIKSICKILDVLSPSVSLHLKKLLSNYLENKRTAKFDNLKITDEETRQNLRLLLVKQLLESNIYMLFNAKDSKRLNDLIERFKLRIDFFNRHEQFTDSIEEVSIFLIDKYVKDFIYEIKNTENKKEKEILARDLTFRLKFFKNYEIFKDAIISLKDEIENLDILTLDSKEIILQIFSKSNTS